MKWVLAMDTKEGYRRWLLVLVVVYVLLSIAVFSTYGVRIVNDSHRYLKYAQRLSEGFYIEPHNVWYFSYVLFVYGVRLLVPGTLATGVVIGQYLLGLLALVALTDAGRRLYDSNRAGIAVGFVYCVFVELTFWHSYVLCESLYVSGVCFLLWSAVRLEHRRS
ncbi:MAG: hypothetical protein AAGA85_15995, partial [Bacteroidota bacterium]